MESQIDIYSGFSDIYSGFSDIINYLEMQEIQLEISKLNSWCL